MEIKYSLQVDKINDKNKHVMSKSFRHPQIKNCYNTRFLNWHHYILFHGFDHQ